MGAAIGDFRSNRTSRPDFDDVMAATKRAAVLAGKPAVTKAAAIEDAHQVHRDRRSETKFDAGTGEYEGGEGNAERRAVVVNRIHELAK